MRYDTISVFIHILFCFSGKKLHRSYIRKPPECRILNHLPYSFWGPRWPPDPRPKFVCLALFLAKKWKSEKNLIECLKFAKIKSFLFQLYIFNCVLSASQKSCDDNLFLNKCSTVKLCLLADVMLVSMIMLVSKKSCFQHWNSVLIMQYFSCHSVLNYTAPTMTRIRNDLILANFKHSIKFFPIIHN
jgi:hypothetical protein